MTELDNGCVVCGPTAARREHTVAESMYRTGESFDYHECLSCGSLQIATVPDDLGRYYDTSRYTSFQMTGNKVHWPWLRYPPVRLALRANTALYLKTGIGRGIPWARKAGIGVNDRVLDIGTGAGENLLRMHLYGYRYLTGTDPFLEEEGEVAPGVPLLKCPHQEIRGEYDWVTLHHSFEHISDPRAMLQSIRGLLRSGGRALVRMPIMGTHAWRTYSTDWVAIDPPRHLVIYTIEALRRLATDEGFEIDRVFFDSWNFQFWGSEVVSSGGAHEGGLPSAAAKFSKQQLDKWSRDAQRLNRSGDGDAAGIVLRPIPAGT